MPLKLLKSKSKQYNVVSKSTFVLSITLLDSGSMECTLDSDSTGNDCLYNISQRLGLHQPEFFGLRYISRGVPPRQRWIQLELPLKKQLEKYAEDPQLSLGVMFYVTDVNLLRDEMSRYHYFLQLKNDIVEEKLNCTLDQAISLAAYSLQAEFGDYDPERHTTEYLHQFTFLPKDLANEKTNLDCVLDAVINQYGSLTGFPPPLAEIYYIMVAQQLEGYGEECFPAKDESGSDILLSVSLNGIILRRRDWTHISALRWNEIKSFLGHKRILMVEVLHQQQSYQFHFNDPEIVKYVRKICSLQSNFFKDSQRLTITTSLRSGVSGIPSVNSSSSSQLPYSSQMTSSSSSKNMLRSSQENFNSNSYASSSNSFTSHHKSFQTLHQSCEEIPGINTQMLDQQHMRTSNSCPKFVVGTSGLISSDLQTQESPNVSGKKMDPAELRSLVPAYRPAPDYETALQLMYRERQHLLPSRSNEQYKCFYNSPSEDEPIYQNDIVTKIHNSELRDTVESQNLYQPKRTPTPQPQVPQQHQLASLGYIDSMAHIQKPPPPYPGSSTPLISTDSAPAGDSVVSSSLSSVQGSKESVNGPSKVDFVPFQNTMSDFSNSSQFGGKLLGNTTSSNPFLKSCPSSNIISLPPYRHIIDTEIMKEFQRIVKAKSNPKFSVAMKPENAKRNRVPNVLPYDDNLVHLTSTKSNPSGYINASPVSAKIGDRVWRYIVGQIPTGGIVGRAVLWQMIWETSTNLIVSLERDSSTIFYPSDSSVLTFGDYQITNYSSTKESDSKQSIARELVLSIPSKKKQRRVWILPYEDEWKDDIPIDTDHFLCFLEEVNSVQRKVSEGSSSPMTILCGTGAGRSGVFVLSDLLLHAADSGHKISYNILLGELRTKRMLLVTHPHQYAFVLDTLAKYLAHSRLI